MRADYVRKCFGEYGRVVQALRTEKAETEFGGGLFEGDVDVVEDLDVIAEKANGLQNDAFVALAANVLLGVLDGRADPRTAGDALALEREEPFRRQNEEQQPKLTLC